MAPESTGLYAESLEIIISLFLLCFLFSPPLATFCLFLSLISFLYIISALLGGEWVDSLLVQKTVSLQLRLLSNHQVSTLIQFFLYDNI